MKQLPQQISQSVRRRNPLLYGVERAPSLPPKPVIRQSSKPKLNKTEAAFGAWLRARYPDSFLTEQSLKFQLANGCWFCPDCVVFHALAGTVDAFDVKGFMRDDAAVKIKVAARLYPFISWKLASKRNGQWEIQNVLA